MGQKKALVTQRVCIRKGTEGRILKMAQRWSNFPPIEVAGKASIDLRLDHCQVVAKVPVSC